jgi:hypothetical protein
MSLETRLAKGVERAMQSPAMVALRTMTMIVCLVAVPLAAVLGTTLPKVVKSAFGGRETRPDTEPVSAAPPENHDLASDAESHEMEPLAMSEGDLPDTAEPVALPQVHITGVQLTDAAPAAINENVTERPPIETAPLWNPSPRTASTVKGGETTTHFIPANSPQGDDRKPPQPAYDVRQRPGPRDDSLRKTVYSPPDEDNQPLDDLSSDEPAVEQSLAPVERVSNDGALADGQRRLRALGVKYYRLEPWGGEGAFYRCSCNVPFSPSGRATRHFDAIEPAPSQALEAVIKQIEVWRARR